MHASLNARRRALLKLGLAPLLAGCNWSSSKSDNPPAGETPTGETPETPDGGTAAGGVILAFGDDNTSSARGESWASKLARMLNRTVVASSRDNETTAQAAGRLESAIRSAKPTAVCILSGTADARNNVDAGNTVSNLVVMVELARALGVQTVVVGTPPAAPATAFAGRLGEIAAGISSVVPGRGGKVADVHGATNNTSLLLEDGYHLNDAGMAVVAAEFSEQL